MTLTDVVSLLALFLSAYSAYKTLEFNRRQNDFANTADHLNKLLLRREQDDAVDAISADLNARVVKIGKGYRLKIYNKGKSPARNIRVEYPVVKEFSIFNDALPLDVIQPGGNFDLLVSTSLGSPAAVTIKILWDDDRGRNQNTVTTISPYGS
ncbi:hypothetical protein [Aeromonas veronii]|uniref:hypothetical protein n=1 Tax=Aeromonas veronii TaxID=654 RepID=UPI001F3BDC5A|nr:hypothetical protein [Aeromonas veronii]MCF5857685.1 hypothetical protein [Aeromonas veronii]